jgi:hypothetical protein
MVNRFAEFFCDVVNYRQVCNELAVSVWGLIVHYTEYVDVFIICDLSSVVLVGLSLSLLPFPLYLMESGSVSM